ncbi:BaiN/RdsA family NAD(P)/FAD-dependent oxidoreductase [Nitrospira japonica]|nr:NAD(P)/FAD-dependent oxidoreductase [Nitrospira japonica]
MRTADVVIVGAGAAGLTAALFATQARATKSRVVLLDGAATVGVKILVSGGGRCNVTHHTVTAADFFGNRRVIKNVLAGFPVQDTIAWFASLGVTLKREETGKLFPVTDKARTVLTSLVSSCQARGVDILCRHRVSRIDRVPDPRDGYLFLVHHSQGSMAAQKVILAMGGRSLPKSGSDGMGYVMAERLGHRVSPTSPALVPLVLDEGMFHQRLMGLSQIVRLTTVIDGKRVDQRIGSLLWTHFGVSGPVVMDASRFWTLARHQGQDAEIFANFLPDSRSEDIDQWLVEQTMQSSQRTVAKILSQRVPLRFAEEVGRHVGCDPSRLLAQCPRQDRLRLVDALSRLRLPIVRDRGWNYAEVTAGGVPLEEVDYRTMESKLVSGLYLIGEMLDCDGRIGGFNFQWAWATGSLAGRAISGT